MGSFFGHALPGTFFIFFALWWTIQAFRRYFESLRKNGSPYVSSATWKVHCGRFGLVDIEAKLVVIMCAVGIIVEVIAAPIFHHSGIGANNAQHGTMYFFFGLVGLMALVLPRMRIFPNHENIVYATLVLAYIVEAGLFKFHLFGRDDLDVMLHTLLLYAIYGCVLCTIFEAKYRDNVLMALARAYCTFLQGTWFWHGAWILYNPFSNPWGQVIDTHGHDSLQHTESESHSGHHGEMESKMHDMMNHERTRRSMDPEHMQMMMVVMAYAWHMAAILILQLVIGAFIGCCARKRGDLDEGKLLMQEMTSPRDKGYTVISLGEEGNEEGEGES